MECTGSTALPFLASTERPGPNGRPSTRQRAKTWENRERKTEVKDPAQKVRSWPEKFLEDFQRGYIFDWKIQSLVLSLSLLWTESRKVGLGTTVEYIERKFETKAKKRHVVKNPGEVRARTCGTKSPSRSEALRFIDSTNPHLLVMNVLTVASLYCVEKERCISAIDT